MQMVMVTLAAVMWMAGSAIGQPTDASGAGQSSSSSAAEASGQAGRDAPKHGASQAPADVPLVTLRIQMRPLPKDQLSEELASWMDRVRTNAQRIAQVQLASQAAEGTDASARTEALNELARLQQREAALVKRTLVVVKAFEAKGGDATQQRQYLAAATGMDVSVTDTTAAWVAVVNWIKSPEGGIRLAWNVVLFVVTIVIAWIIAVIVATGLRRALKSRASLSEMLREFFVTTTRRLLLLVGLIVALSMLEVNIAPLLAALGGIAFIVAFALQGSLSNFASGLMILFYRPFDVDDVIEVAGVMGIAKSVNLMTTEIRSFDNQTIIIPNNQVWGSVITNVTGNDTRRVDLTFGISYSDDVAKAAAILEELARNHELTLDDPEPNIKMHELADSSVNLICRPWCKTSDYWTVYWDLMRQVKQRFDSEGISIPFPQRDVHVHQHAAPGDGPSA